MNPPAAIPVTTSKQAIRAASPGHPFVQELRTGWRDLLGATLGLACGIACYTPVSSLFFRALEHEFGWSKAAAAASLVALPVTALFLPFAGSLLDRYGVRRVALASVITMAACFLWLSSMEGSLITFYTAFIALNVLGCATSPVSYTRTVAAHFQRARGLALAVSLIGISVAGMLLPPVLAAVLEESGWRAGYRFLAVMTCVGGLLAVALIGSESRRASSGAGDLCLRLGAAVRTRAFWFLAVAIFATSAASIGFVSQFQSVLIENGLTISRATLLLSSLAASVFMSRAIVGWALDVFPPEQVAAITMGLAAIGAALLLTERGSFASALAGVLLIGFSIGAELDLMSYFCARRFGLRHYGSVYGGLAVFFYGGMAAGAVMYGLVHDFSGTYSAALATSSGLFLCAACVFLALGRVPQDAPSLASAASGKIP